MSSKTRISESLNVPIAAAIVVWAATFAAVHGMFVFGYIAMHAITTGLFLLAIRRTDKQVSQAELAASKAVVSPSRPVARRSTERVAQTQPAA